VLNFINVNLGKLLIFLSQVKLCHAQIIRDKALHKRENFASSEEEIKNSPLGTVIPKPLGNAGFRVQVES